MLHYTTMALCCSSYRDYAQRKKDEEFKTFLESIRDVWCVLCVGTNAVLSKDEESSIKFSWIGGKIQLTDI